MSKEITVDVSEQVNQLIKSAEAELSKGIAIEVHDHMGIAEKYLTNDAKIALGRKATQQIHVENGKAFICTYFGVRVPKTELETGALRLATIANELAEKGLIHSTLAPIASVDLIQQAMEVPNCVMFLYVLVPAEELKTVENNYHPWSIKEGCMPPELVSVKEKLAPGEFSAVVRVSHALSMIAGGTPSKDRVQKEIDTLLAVLPEGTTILHKRDLPIVSTCYEVEVRFFNPLMYNIKKVELDYVRVAAPDKDNQRVIQGNLLLGVSYYGEDGKKLFQPIT